MASDGSASVKVPERTVQQKVRSFCSAWMHAFDMRGLVTDMLARCIIMMIMHPLSHGRLSCWEAGLASHPAPSTPAGCIWLRFPLGTRMLAARRHLQGATHSGRCRTLCISTTRSNMERYTGQDAQWVVGQQRMVITHVRCSGHLVHGAL